jgi:hypothetical protein
MNRCSKNTTLHKRLYTVKKLKNYILGSSFKLLREDLARRASIAYATLWNFYLLATSLFLLLPSCILYHSYVKRTCGFLKQPLLSIAIFTALSYL